jgi:hypothetical protein
MKHGAFNETSKANDTVFTFNSFHKAKQSTKLITWKYWSSYMKPELRPNDWILHHNNAPANKVPSIKEFLAQKSVTEMITQFIPLI